MGAIGARFFMAELSWQPGSYGNSFRSGSVWRGMVAAARSELWWTKLISERMKRGQGREALAIYKQMREEAVLPKTYTFVAALKACSSIPDLEAGKEIHTHAIQNGCHVDIYVANTLLDMYARCDSLLDARRVFEHMPHHDVVSWNAIIRAYAQSKDGQEALRLYALMQHQGFLPNARTFVAALQACAILMSIEEGRQVGDEILKLGCLEKSRAIHSQARNSGFETDKFVANTLIDVYAKCGSMLAARQVFENMQRNMVSWNAMIMGHAHLDNGEMALQLFARMQHEGFMPDARTFVAALKACASLAVQEQGEQVDGELVKVRCLEKGRAIHCQVTKSGFEKDRYVANTLVDVYAKCGSMVEASQVFEWMQHRDVISWTGMIMGYAQKEKGELALHLYAHMQDEHIAPNAHTFVAILKACSSMAVQEETFFDGELVNIEWLEKGRNIHFQLAKSGFESNLFVASALVSMYSKFGSMVDACLVFKKMSLRDVVSWTAMITGYAQREEGEMALQLYERMQDEGFRPDAFTFVAALKACGNLAAPDDGMPMKDNLVKSRCLEKGRAIHCQVAKSGLELDMCIASTLIDMYMKCGSMVDAAAVFEKLTDRDVMSWNAMIMGYAQRDEGELALQLYAQMQHEGFTPNSYTFVATLMACGSLAKQKDSKRLGLEIGRDIHSQFIKIGLVEDIFVASTLVDMYAKCGSMVDALNVFENMAYRNVVTWTAMIMGYAQVDEVDLALRLYAHMQDEGFIPNAHTLVAALKACSSLAEQEEGKKVNGELVKTRCLENGRIIHSQLAKGGFESDKFVANALVSMYAKSGSMVDARLVFEKMEYHDHLSWNALIMGYALVKEADLALQLYARMQHEGFVPDAGTFVAALKACNSAATLGTGRWIHAEICRSGLEDEVNIATCLLDMYGRCGSMVDAQHLFDKLPVKDVVAWSSLIAGYSVQGDKEYAIHLFESMQQDSILPDSITFVSLLKACSHTGLVDKGQMYFHVMCYNYGITPVNEHYSCMVDLLGRAGWLDEAVTMVMQIPFQPDVLTWVTILSACQKWNNVEVGRHAFQCAVKLDGKQATPYILLTNLYSSVHLCKEISEFQDFRMSSQVCKSQGDC